MGWRRRPSPQKIPGVADTWSSALAHCGEQLPLPAPDRWARRSCTVSTRSWKFWGQGLPLLPWGPLGLCQVLGSPWEVGPGEP